MRIEDKLLARRQLLSMETFAKGTNVWDIATTTSVHQSVTSEMFRGPSEGYGATTGRLYDGLPLRIPPSRDVETVKYTAEDVLHDIHSFVLVRLIISKLDHLLGL